MLVDDDSCVRFTAASSGPIYFVLSAIPATFETWYYFRITNKDVTVYKGDKKLAHETDATGAVGLGDASLFQSFMVCSEYSPTRTRLSFSKVAADETINEGAEINTFLQIDDEEDNIQPSFYSFGTGEREVQIVDIEPIEETGSLVMTCAGDTGRGEGSGCVTQCKISELMENSNIQREELTCTQPTSLNRSSTTDRVAAGGQCFLNCSDPAKVESWVGAVECGVDGEWSISQLPLKCIATCQEDVITKGKKMVGTSNNPTIEDLVMTREEVLANHCTALRVEDRKLFEEDMVCSFGSRETDGCNGDEEEPLSICGEDSEGLVYRQRGDKVRCNVNGQWESVCDKSLVDEPICVAQPCPEIEVTDVADAKTITYSTDPVSEHYNEGTEGNLECEERYVPLSGKDATVCEAGEWSVQMECVLK